MCGTVIKKLKTIKYVSPTAQSVALSKNYKRAFKELQRQYRFFRFRLRSG